MATNTSKIRKFNMTNGSNVASFNVDSTIVFMGNIKVSTGHMVIAVT